jgi:hypothetical protein
MAGIRVAATTAEVALTAATARTVLQVVAAANHRVLVEQISVSFDGISPTAEPVIVELLRQTTAGTMSALTPVKLSDAGSETIQTTAQHSATAEPTAGDVLWRVEIHPQTGIEKLFPLGQEMIVAGGGRLGVRCTAPAAVNVVAGLVVNE